MYNCPRDSSTSTTVPSWCCATNDVSLTQKNAKLSRWCFHNDWSHVGWRVPVKCERIGPDCLSQLTMANQLTLLISAGLLLTTTTLLYILYSLKYAQNIKKEGWFYILTLWKSKWDFLTYCVLQNLYCTRFFHGSMKWEWMTFYAMMTFRKFTFLSTQLVLFLIAFIG